MFLSVFDVFKIGIGPSSSHTMGPMVAAGRFLDELKRGDWPRPAGARVASISASLHGSLAFTGVGHASGRAVILGLSGFLPESVDPDRMESVVADVEASGLVRPEGHPAYRFRPKLDLVFDKAHPMPGHPNGLQFSAFDADGTLLLRRGYYSVGGGFVVSEAELGAATPPKGPAVPFPFGSASEMLEMAGKTRLSIAEMKRANEQTTRPRQAVDAGLDRIWQVMSDCIDRGLKQQGQLPGGLKVPRRAHDIHETLLADRGRNLPSPLQTGDWLSVFAMAVNEENAAGGRVVTAPTNGAAGVIPAVLRFYREQFEGADAAATRTFLLTAAAIGGIIKHKA